MAEPPASNPLSALARRAAAGDAAAKDELAAAVYPRVRDRVHRELELDFRRHHRWILPLFSTGDVVQDVFAGVLRALDADFAPADDEALLRYLTTICRNRLVDAVRHHEAAQRDPRRQQELAAGDASVIDEPAGADATPSVHAALDEQLRAFRAVLDGFPERTRALLEMRLCDEESFEVIAERLGWATANAAGKAFRAAKARLLLRLQERGVQAPEDPA